MRTVTVTILISCLIPAMLSMPGAAQERSARQSAAVVVDEDGTVHVPAMEVPLSGFLSPEARTYVTQHLRDMQKPEVVAQVDGIPRFMKGTSTVSESCIPSIARTPRSPESTRTSTRQRVAPRRRSAS